MKLRDYIKNSGLTPLQFAHKIGLKSRSSLYRYMGGQRIPCADMLENIFQATNGMVTDKDFTPAKSFGGIAANTNRNHIVCILSSELAETADLAAFDLSQFSHETAANENMTYPLWQAKQVLGSRLEIDVQSNVILDGRPTVIKKAIQAANHILYGAGMATIYYPGVQEFDDKSSPHMKIRFPQKI